jgi:hypothetical protein
MSRPLPGLDVPLVDPQTGLMTQTWAEYFQSIQKLSQLPDVSTTTPTNGQVLIWNSTTMRWTPGTN